MSWCLYKFCCAHCDLSCVICTQLCTAGAPVPTNVKCRIVKTSVINVTSLSWSSLFASNCFFLRLLSFIIIFFSFLTYFPYFERWKKFYAISMVSVYLCICVFTSINFWIAEPFFMKLGVYTMAPEPISGTYFINLSHQSVSIVSSNSSERNLPWQRIHMEK
jgi:hypothetical protein